jgi:hypothetical protein
MRTNFQLPLCGKVQSEIQLRMEEECAMSMHALCSKKPFCTLLQIHRSAFLFRSKRKKKKEKINTEMIEMNDLTITSNL